MFIKKETLLALLFVGCLMCIFVCWTFVIPALVTTK